MAGHSGLAPRQLQPVRYVDVGQISWPDQQSNSLVNETLHLNAYGCA